MHRTGLILVTTAALAWSTSGLFTRSLALDAATILFWRGAFGGLGLLVLLACMPATGGLASLRALRGPGLAYAAVTAVSMVLFVSALLTTSVAHVVVLTATVPFVAGALGWVLLRERPARSAVIASLAALAGVAVMVGLGADGTWTGDVLAMLMAACMGGMILIARRHPDIPALAATCVASALGALVMLPFATLGIGWADMAMLALFALVNQVLGFGAFAVGARYLPPMETALLTALDAPLAPLWVWLVLSETPTRATLAGGAIVMVAVLAHIARGARS